MVSQVLGLSQLVIQADDVIHRDHRVQVRLDHLLDQEPRDERVLTNQRPILRVLANQRPVIKVLTNERRVLTLLCSPANR